MSLVHELEQFTGTEHWYRHSLVPGMLYTDGIKYFAEQAGAYWFLDIVATEYLNLQRREQFLLIKLDVSGSQAKIRVEDGDGHGLKRKDIDFTDCPEGKYKFFFTNDTLHLPSEY